jgi:hypothetical protein
MRRTLSGFQVSLAAMAAILIALATATAATAQDKTFRFTSERGLVSELIATRQVGTLTGATVRISSPAGYFTVMEVLHDCDAGRYAYAGMTYGSGTDSVADADRAREVQDYTDVDLSSRLREKNYFPVSQMGSPGDKALFAHVCRR